MCVCRSLLHYSSCESLKIHRGIHLIFESESLESCRGFPTSPPRPNMFLIGNSCWIWRRRSKPPGIPVAVCGSICRFMQDIGRRIIHHYTVYIYIYRTLRNYNIAIQHNMFYHVIPHAASCRVLVAVPSMAMGTVSLCTVLQDVPLRPTVKHERFQVPLEVHYCAFTCIYGNLVSAPSEWIGECFWSRLPDCGFWVAGFSPEL